MTQDIRNETFQQAVIAMAATMNTPENKGRLPKAIDLVLAGGVTLHDDGTATVKSGNQTYDIDLEDGCPCADSQHRGQPCKHALAVELLTRAQAHLAQQGNGTAPMPQMDASRSAAWAVSEAPASCCLKFQMGTVECMYTMRDTNDDTLFARVRRILPKLLDKVNGNTPESQPQQDTPRCSMHNVLMKRFTKGDQVWHSHKAPDGSWCRGK